MMNNAPQRKRIQAIDSFGITPVYSGVLIHDRWASYFAYDLCKHQVCGSHLLRDLTFVVDSNNCRWARLMKKLLCEIRDEVNKSEIGVLSEAECRKNRKRYRTILTQVARKYPPRSIVNCNSCKTLEELIKIAMIAVRTSCVCSSLHVRPRRGKVTS